MAALAMDNYTGSPGELLEQAREISKTPESAAMLLAAVNKRLAEIAPGEEPVAAANRLSVERDDWAIKSAYRHLDLYYEDSCNPELFSVSYEDIDHEELIGVAEDMLWILSDRIA